MHPGKWSRTVCATLTTALVLGAIVSVSAQPPPPKESVFAKVDNTEPFAQVMARMKRAKPELMRKHMEFLSGRYDLSRKVTNDVKMSRGKPVPVGPTARLKGVTWDELGRMTPDQIRDRGVFPYLPLPHISHPEGGMVFPKMMLEKEERLTRFDMDFDLPEHFLPEFPPAIFLITRKDLGDVSKGQLVTAQNFFELFNGILNPKQLDGLRLLVTQFPQQQFNHTDDRRTEKPSLGVTCFDCHVNGHTNAATHLVGDIRPQANRRRIDTPSLRGVNIQRLFGSQRALKTVEDFTEFEQRAAYFDGDPVIATKKGINPLERGSQVHAMSEFQAILDFPPAPKLNLFGKLDPKKATQSELRGQELFFGKAQCGDCHPAPYYTDNLMHDLKVERFYKPQVIHDQFITAQGPIKTFTLRGIKESPPYLHDGRLLTLEDVVEFFNMIQEIQLTADEKKDLVAFLRQL
jgi:cytochrome c peroxidase